MKLFRLLIFILIPTIIVAQKNKKNEDDGTISEKELQAEAVFTEGMKLFIAENYEKAIPHFKKSVEMNPASSGAAFMLSKAFFANEDLTNATIYGEKAMKIDDANKYYQKYMGELYTKQKRFKEAQEVYENLSKRHPYDVENYLDLSNTYILQGKYNDAIEIYNKIEKTIGLSEEITRQKQLIYLKQEKLDKAIEEGNKLIDSEPNEPEYIIQQAQIMIQNNRYEQAVKMIEKALSINPDFGQGHVLLAEIYRKQGDLVKCNEELKVAFANKNLSAEVKFKLLSSYMLMLKEDNGDKALDNIMGLTQDLIKQNPKESRGYVILGDLLMKKGEMAQARDNYVKATQYDKSVYEVWLAIVELDGKLNHIDSLAKHSEQAIEYFPNQAFFWYHNGFAHFVKKDYKKSAESLKEASNLAIENPDLAKHINALLGDVYNELRQHSKSDDAYEAVLKDDPYYEHVLNNYSYYLAMRKEKLERAVELSGKLIEKYKDNATYLDTHAWVLYTMKDYAKAREFLEIALKQNNRLSGTIIEHYGDVLYQLGEKEKAIEQWKKAKGLGENSPNIDKKIQQGTLIE
jgi:tetratricopeptide (TPR) repeat protein